MTVQIESIGVENFGCFRGEHHMRLRNQDSTPEVIVGANATGKTTLANAIQLCLSGHPREEFPPLNQQRRHLGSGESVDSALSVVLSDDAIDSRIKFTRTLRVSQTPRGVVYSIDSLRAYEDEAGEWVETRSGLALDRLFPSLSLTFSFLDAESTIGNEHWGGVGLYDLVANVGDAAARQAVSRGLDLPDWYSTGETLREELLSRINEKLASFENRYLVELGDGGLVGKYPTGGSGGPTYALPTGQVHVISQTAAIVASDLLPASPPIVGDSLYGRLDSDYRRNMFNLLQESHCQPLLFLTESECDGLDVDPSFELVYTEREQGCAISPLE
ncbi:AAA family ATPase [Salinigranum halophilum]|uniref:AAA family ATPase n=1 Tax=Salinigranum halophilum TaxID=2565931 RepID=UPI0037420CB4